MPVSADEGADSGRARHVLAWTVPGALMLGLLTYLAVAREGRITGDLARLAEEADRLESETRTRAERLARLEKATDVAPDAASLQIALDAESVRIRVIEESSESPERQRGVEPALMRRSESLARLERTVADLGSRLPPDPRADAVATGKRILDGLAAIVDDSRPLAVENAFRELVRLGDPVVPGIASLLDSGLQRDCRAHGFPVTKGDRVAHSSLRAVLYDSLGQIGSPAARDAALASAAKSASLGDMEVLLLLFRGDSDPVVVEKLSALVPVALRQVAALGAAKAEEENILLSRWLGEWIREHRMTGTAGLLEEVVSGAKPGPDSWSGPDFRYFTVLADLAPDGAVRVVLTLQRKYPDLLPEWMQAVRSFTNALNNNVPLAVFARYLDLLLTQGDLSRESRKALYYAASTVPFRLESWTREESLEDAEALAAFLESRLTIEKDPGVQEAIRSQLARLRKALERTQR